MSGSSIVSLIYSVSFLLAAEADAYS